MAYLKGFGIGLATVFLIGPVFFTLLKTTLKYGMFGGMMVAWGIFISDVVCVALCSFGAIPFFTNPDNKFWLAIAGSTILFGLGLKYVFKPTMNFETNDLPVAAHYTTFFAKGFLVNFVNPVVFLVWISIIGVGQVQYKLSGNDLGIFLTCVLLGILTIDTIKVLFAHRIKPLIKPEYLFHIYRVIGVVLIVFGIRMLWIVL